MIINIISGKYDRKIIINNMKRIEKEKSDIKNNRQNIMQIK